MNAAIIVTPLMMFLNQRRMTCCQNFKLFVVCQDKEIEGLLVDYAKNSLEFVTQWGVSIPTTCCYKFIIPEKLREKQFDCIQFFC